MNDKLTKQKSKIDPVITGIALVVVIAFIVAIAMDKVKMDAIMTTAFYVVFDNLGWAFELLLLGTLVLCVWLIFGKYKDKRFGNEKPDSSTFSFYALMFVTATSATIIYWAVIEFYSYLEGPPFGVEPFSLDALRWGSTYGSYHWGIVPYSSYAAVGIAFAYMMYVRKRKNTRVGTACIPIIGERNADGLLGRIMDSFFLIAQCMATAGYTMGVSVPLIANFMVAAFGVEHTLFLDAYILIGLTVLMTLAMYTGLNKGMKVISNVRLVMCFGILCFVFLIGPKAFILNNTLESITFQLNHLIEMSGYTDVVGGSGWPQGWTIYFAAMFICPIASHGMYLGRLCKGRTVRECVIGVILANAVGCMIWFWVLGNFSLHTYLGDPATFKAMMAADPYQAITYVIQQMPLASIVMIIFVAYAFISLWTNASSNIYTMAMITQPTLKENEEPSKINRVFWCIAISALALAFLYIGGLQTVKNTTIYGAVPSLVLASMILISFLLDLKHNGWRSQEQDHEKNSSSVNAE